jgi:hypothetical protein
VTSDTTILKSSLFLRDGNCFFVFSLSKKQKYFDVVVRYFLWQSQPEKNECGNQSSKPFSDRVKRKEKKSFLRGPKNGKRQHTPPHQLPLENNFC